ncbi:Lrp/AsnC family transcriptional regulator [Thioclava sp. GXIMD4216]|uniref:Lrp/AsnC family transcriptional regulator n=1 Tax=Thioclava litoralis TaxID=3076557 RepID=A0ABZ1E2W8_9RHOB|nr:Lrp/AsnC family transcriptional regulator [Thioclava sp. FTW29]
MTGESVSSDQLDDTDRRLIAALRRDGRAAVSDLATQLNLSRATVRSRIEKMISRGEITGFSVQTRSDAPQAAVRGVMLLEIDGRQTDQIVQNLLGLPLVQAVHTTNGQWDLLLEIGARNLQEFDDLLLIIRAFEGVRRSETSLLLGTRRPAVIG